ncbi:hypothetical protein FRC14_002648 [Serendipita sp. 396]|nr:hypothetical protein FRC14_002648 [Serendipita sp. 396]
MDDSDNKTSTEWLQEAFSLVEYMEIHQALCGDLISFSLEQDAKLQGFDEWIKITREIRNAIYEWSELNAIGSFLKCDMISGKVASLRSTIAALNGDTDDATNSPGGGVSAASTLVPTLLVIYRDPRAVETFAALPTAHRDTAISLLRRVLTSTREDLAISEGSTSAKEPPTLRELVAATILHLERKDIDAALSEVPDLTEEVDLKEGKAFGSSSLGMILLGQRKGYGSVLLKTLKYIDLTDAKRYRSLQRELKTRLSLSHPYLLPFLGFASTPQGFALVSPHTANGTAPHYLASHEYPNANAISLLFSVAKGLQYLHECWPAITHGDVRGANIWINGRGEPLLGDWGLYEFHEGNGLYEAIRWAAPELVCSEADLRRIAATEKPPPEWGTAHLTPAQAVNGTSEDALIEVYTPLSDVWSFGMTIYEYAMDSAIPLALKQGERPIPPTSTKEVRIEWQPELWVLMQDCWRSDRRTRPTMESVSRRLESVLERSKGSLGCLDRFRSGSVSSRSPPGARPRLSPILHKTSMPNLKSLSPLSMSGLSRAASPSETDALRLHSQSPSGSISISGRNGALSPTNSISSARTRAVSPFLAMNGRPTINASGSAPSISSPSSRADSSLSRPTLQSPTLSATASNSSISKVKKTPKLRQRVSAIFSGGWNLTGSSKDRYITPILSKSPDKAELSPTLPIQEPNASRESLQLSEKMDVIGPALEVMTLTERRAYEQKHGLQRGFLQTGSQSGSGRSTPQMRSPTSPKDTRSPASSIHSNSLRNSTSLTQMRPVRPDLRKTIASPTASVPADFPISHHHTRTSEDSPSVVNLPTRHRASGPYSVASENSSSSAVSPISDVSYQSDHTFNIIVEDVDEASHDLGESKELSVMTTESGDFPNNTSGEDSVQSHSDSDLIQEAFQGISMEPSDNGHSSNLPEDVGSPHGETSNLPNQLAQPKSPLERSMNPETMSQCQRVIGSFIKGEATFILAPIAQELELLVFGSSESLKMAISTLQPVLQDLKAARQRLIDRINDRLPITGFSNLRDFFDVFEASLGTFKIIYQEYVKTLEELEAAICDSRLGRYSSVSISAREQVSKGLRLPFTRLDETSTLLKNVVSISKPSISAADILSWGQISTEWQNFSYKMKLLVWQNDPSPTPLLLFTHEDLIVPLYGSERDSELQHGARFSVIAAETKLVRSLQMGQKALTKHPWEDESASIALLETITKVSQLHLALMQELHVHQRDRHPHLPPITSFYLRAMPQWEDVYALYGRVVDFALQNLELTKAIRDLLVQPLLHLKDLSKLLKSLFDVTPDHHFDVELIIRLIPAVDHIVELTSKIFPEDPVDSGIVNLQEILLWENAEQEETAGLKSSSQRVLHSGTLHYPVDPDGQRKSIEDRGTSVKVVVILTNSCLIIAESRSRMGIKRYPVRAVIALHDLLIPDVELARVSQQQIFLLNSSDGKRIASPLQLRYRDALTPRKEVPRLRATSAVSMLGVREDDGQRLLFPKELVLLATSSGERTMWRERLIKAKHGAECVPAKKPVTKSMFRMTTVTRLPFLPSASALLPTRGSRSVLICADGGAYLQEDMKPLMSILGPGPVKQCCVIEALRIVLFLIGKTLFAVRLEDIGEQDSPPPGIIKTNVTLFHIGYHRGLLLLVVASEGSRSTTLKLYTGMCRGRSGMVSPGFFGKSGKSFKSLCEQEIAGSVHSLDILDDGIVAIGTTGFQLVSLDGTITRVLYLPVIKAGASSEAAQRSKTSKALGVCRSGSDILLCYADFGLYVNATGEILGRSIDWTIPKVSSVAFAPPYFFLLSENHIEVRQIGSGKKLETIEGTGFRLVRGVDEARSLSRSLPSMVEDGEISGDVALEAVEQESALLHLVVRAQDADGEFDLVELQMEVLDLTA